MEKNEVQINLQETELIPFVFDSKPLSQIFPEEKTIVLLLDYDGTLSPIVNHPEDAHLSDSMRDALQSCAAKFTTAIISGRDMDDVIGRVKIDEIIYAGSHGFRIKGPEGLKMKHKKTDVIVPDLENVAKELAGKFSNGPEGVKIEKKMYAIAVHYRNVREDKYEEIKEKVNEVVSGYPDMKTGKGKKIIEIKPNINWHKGMAVQWILESLDLWDAPDILPVYIGDDVTDEDAFKTLYTKGLGMLVGNHGDPSAAGYRLRDVDEVKKLLELLSARKK